MSNLTAAGDSVAGAMATPALEAQTEAKGVARESICLNCGEALVGSYCHRCGQRGHVHRTLAAWWHDFLHSVLHLDGKFWRTMPMLAFRPGVLTRRYALGERKRFISPLALFLFTVFLMFAAMSLWGGGNYDARPTIEAQGEIQSQLTARQQSLEALVQTRAMTASEGGDTSRIDARIADLRKEIWGLNSARNFANPGTAGREEFTAIGIRTGWARLDRAIDQANRNPALLFYKLQANAYKFSWALIPISVPFVWILFLHRRRYRAQFTAYDHLVFVTYSIAFMSLALIMLVLFSAAGLAGWAVALLALLVPPLHIYRQLRGAYGLSRGSAVWRALLMTIFAFLALSLFTVLLLLLGMLS